MNKFKILLLSGIGLLLILTTLIILMLTIYSEEITISGYEPKKFPIGFVEESPKYKEIHKKISNERYRTALSDLDEFSRSDSVNYLKAVCQYKLKNYEEALNLAKSIAPGFVEKQSAEFLTGLIYWQIKDYKKAKFVFLVIRQQPIHVYNEKAAKILEEEVFLKKNQS